MKISTPNACATLALACLLLIGCSKKSAPAPAKTVLTGYYSMTGIYSINADGTYTALPPGSCRGTFSLYLGDGGQMNVQSECQNFAGTWGYASGILTIAKSDGTPYIRGEVEFEADGITIDVNSTVDNFRYRLYRN
jgi:hypothetical protein